LVGGEVAEGREERGHTYAVLRDLREISRSVPRAGPMIGWLHSTLKRLSPRARVVVIVRLDWWR
jgi:hypothetical protein